MRGTVDFIKQKIFPFALIVGLGAIVVVWTAVSTVLFGAIEFLLDPVLGGFAGILLRILQIILSLGLGTLLFAIIFKILPETIIEWRDVWLAALLTAIIFTALNYLFGIYLSLVTVTTLAGTAGALIVLFLWIYATNLFILFGAQFSRVYAQAFGSQKGKLTPPAKRPPLSELVRVDMTAELNVKVRDNKEGS